MYNQTFFDFFGITDDQMRNMYSSVGKIVYLPELCSGDSPPIPPIKQPPFPPEGINGMGISIVTNKSGKWTTFEVVSLIIVILLLLWLGWLIYKTYFFDEAKENFEELKEDHMEAQAS